MELNLFPAFLFGYCFEVHAGFEEDGLKTLVSSLALHLSFQSSFSNLPVASVSQPSSLPFPAAFVPSLALVPTSFYLVPTSFVLFLK